MEWKDYSFKADHNGDKEDKWKLGVLREKFTLECIWEERVWVAHNYKPDKDGYCWMDFAFFEFSTHTCGTPDTEIELSKLMHGCGPAGTNGLRECRHTYWGEDGYIFYPNKEAIERTLSWLKRYYDLD